MSDEKIARLVTELVALEGEDLDVLAEGLMKAMEPSILEVARGIAAWARRIDADDVRALTREHGSMTQAVDAKARELLQGIAERAAAKRRAG